MNTLFILLSFACLIMLLIGIVKPNLFKKKSGEAFTRKEIAITCVFLFIIFLFLTGLTAEKNGQSKTDSTPLAAQKNNPILTEKISIINTPTTKPMVTPLPTKPLTLEEKIKSILPESMSEVIIDIEDAQDFQTFASINGMKDITIYANHTGTYWNVQMMKEATWMEASNIIQKIFPLDSTIHGVIIMNEIPVTTAYGKKDKDALTTISISRDIFNKIEFNNFDYKNIPTIADSYVENHNIKD